ncbi:MAG: DUF933 domain-containing protein [Candidatus Binataceae bacterium]
MKAGIIGGRGTGKSTVFRALTGLRPIPGAADAKARARPGQIKVADARLDTIESLYSSQKKVQAELTVVDFAPNPKEQKEGAALDPSLIPLIRDIDALLVVIPQIAAMDRELVAEVRNIDAELVFADFAQAERRLERMKKEKAPSDIERAALEKCVTTLEHGKALRTIQLTTQEKQALAGYGFLSQKPALVVTNCEYDRATSAITDSERDALREHGLEAFRLAAAFEAELWELDADAHREFLKEAGLDAPARDRLVAALSTYMGLLTYYTAGENEARAWTLPRGATALDAAANVHSDLARGFIRAEVMSHDEFVALGSEAKMREAGKLRLEGRDYVVKDADILKIRFKV